MTVIRYINNGSEPVSAGGVTVPAYDQLIRNEFVQALDALAGKSLKVLVDGVELTEDLVPSNAPVVSVTSKVTKPVVIETE